MKASNRTQARALALQALCLFDAMKNDFREQLGKFLHDEENFEDLGIESVDKELVDFARSLAEGAWEHCKEYDRMLVAAVPDWSIKRMPLVDRNIMRLGLHEWQTHSDTPFSVIVNEAIELARRFGGTDSPKFVNGVLDGIRKRTELAETATPQPAPDTAKP
ncbi:MAG: transcription antitermination factor NusB [Phycisphaerae bacterium]